MLGLSSDHQPFSAGTENYVCYVSWLAHDGVAEELGFFTDDIFLKPDSSNW
jgi:hypothetical protein